MATQNVQIEISECCASSPNGCLLKAHYCTGGAVTVVVSAFNSTLPPEEYKNDTSTNGLLLNSTHFATAHDLSVGDECCIQYEAPTADAKGTFPVTNFVEIAAGKHCFLPEDDRPGHRCHHPCRRDHHRDHHGHRSDDHGGNRLQASGRD